MRQRNGNEKLQEVGQDTDTQTEPVSTTYSQAVGANIHVYIKYHPYSTLLINGGEQILVTVLHNIIIVMIIGATMRISAAVVYLGTVCATPSTSATLNWIPRVNTLVKLHTAERSKG